MVTGGTDAVRGPLFVRFQVDIWVEVIPDEPAGVNVIVDERSMERPVGVVDGQGAIVDGRLRDEAMAIATTAEWDSWDYQSFLPWPAADGG